MKMVTLSDRRPRVATLPFFLVCCLFISATCAISSNVTLTEPTVLPYTCRSGEVLQSCGTQQLCDNKNCGRQYRCIESYCGTCQATCAKIQGLSTSCGKARKFSPVCGRDGRTYASVCHARRAGVKVAAKGPCKSPDNSCTCDLEHAPVCGSDNKYYINKCVAELCAAVQSLPLEKCAPQEADCYCPLIYSPVCGIDNVTYGNSCEAACEGVPVAYIGECGTCKALQQACALSGQECCPGLVCRQPGPVDQANVTVGVCKNPSEPSPIG